MTPLYKTAYPYYSEKKKIAREGILQEYRLTYEEIQSIKKHWSEHIDSQLCYGVLLMVFKNLNYFPAVETIPKDIIEYVAEQLQLPTAQFNVSHASTLDRYRKRIYKYYDITPWKYAEIRKGETVYPAQIFVKKIAMEASKTHNYPADIINIVVEQCKKNHIELPTFKQLDRQVRHERATINQQLFDEVYASLSDQQIEQLDLLLKTTEDYQRTGYHALKEPPKNPTISNFRELLKHHDWLVSFGDLYPHLKHIIPMKLKQFSQQARSLDASNLNDFASAKRYALLLSLIFDSKIRSKDALAITFRKTIMSMHKKSKDKLERLREFYRTRTQDLLMIFSNILGVMESEDELQSLQNVRNEVDVHGGVTKLKTDCDQSIALNSNNHLVFLVGFFPEKRSTLLRLLETLDLRSSTQETSLINAIRFILKNKHIKDDYIESDIDLSFTTDQWRKLIYKKGDENSFVHRTYLELCVVSHVADELRSKDLFIVGADSYADYREGLLPLNECEKILDDYCEKVGIASTGIEGVKQLKEKLMEKARTVDSKYPEIAELTVDQNGKPTLHKRGPKKRPNRVIWLEKIIKLRMKKRNLLDVFCSSHFYCGWGNEFGPLSGDEPKMKDPIERYLLTSFAYATGLGPTQTVLHVRSAASAHMLSWVNQRHITPESLDKAREKLINLIAQFKLTQSWGDGTSVAADGTMQELREQNLIAEFHFRYKKKGGIAYHHVADNYILLFSTFMSCGVWEAVEIIEGLLKNNSDVQPDIIHGDTQAQSTVVFALAYLLGFRLMPRIRHWHDLKLFRPSKTEKYQHIDALFTDTIDWELIEKHWQDMMQVILSIREGKMSSSKLLRKLGNYSRKNRLYQAFQELGYVIRTLFLLEYISDVELRETITAQTNKVEAYNALSDWCAFGSNILVASNDDIEMEKAVKYNDILTNAVILQNVSDMTEIIAELIDDGHPITKEDMSYLCPYWTSHIKRFGDMVMDFNNVPKSVEKSRRRVLW